MKSHAKGATQKAYLCSPLAVHIQSEGWDRGWGCGCVLILSKLGLLTSMVSYRNYLMACAPLMDQQVQPAYSKLLESPEPPGVRRLQRLIEQAWKAGT